MTNSTITVPGPIWHNMTVTAVLHPLADAVTDGMAAAARDAVVALFDPRRHRIGSAEYVCNWGQSVHRSEILAVLQALPGVAWVDLSVPSSDAGPSSPVAFPRLSATPTITVAASRTAPAWRGADRSVEGADDSAHRG